jgi:hypothetical protein
MRKNVGGVDRLFRALGGSALVVCAFLAPVPVWARVAGLGGGGLYLLATALIGSCLGYRLMGRSTCPAEARSG